MTHEHRCGREERRCALAQIASGCSARQVLARETLTALPHLAAPDLFRNIVGENGTKLLKITA